MICECKLNFHLSSTQFGNISNYSKFCINKDQWKCETCYAHNFTVRKRNKDLNNDAEQSKNFNIIELNGIQSSINSILIKLK